MDYYKRRILANKLVDKMLSDGKSKEAIIYQIDTIYGLSEKFVVERLKKIERLKNELSQ